MGVEHSCKEEGETQRCPCCGHVSTLSTADSSGCYFYCQNPKCNVERIYGDNAVMVSNG
jgi:hypothetical protein